MKKRLWQRLLAPARVDGAWQHVKSNKGAPGVDGISIEEFEADYTAQVDALISDLRRGAYRCQGYRVALVPKSSGGHRRLVIPTVRDRLLQTTAIGFLTPKIEKTFHPSSFAYRRRKGVQDALDRVTAERKSGRNAVLLADIHQFFDTVPHGPLFAMLSELRGVGGVLPLLRQWLSAPLVENEKTQALCVGLPQGLPISPLLANFYLTPFDRYLAAEGHRLIRYADDFAVCCPNTATARQALRQVIHALSWLGLELNGEKTGITDFGAGFHFLGAKFHGKNVIPALPHPYEADLKPPPKPRRPPRQTLPRKMLRTLYMQDQGSLLRRKGDRFALSQGKKDLLELPIHQIDQIFAFGGVHFTTPALTLALTRNIPIHLLSSHGRYYGQIHAPHQNNFTLRRRQFQLLDDEKARLAFAIRIVDAKVRGSVALLERHQRNHPDTELDKTIRRLKASLKRIPHAKGLEQLRGIEGAAAAEYYLGFARCLRGDLSFNGRTRHPPTDPLNSLLSFGYTIVFYDLCSMLWAHGIDPHVGLYHEPGPRHPALASDLLEAFRAPLVDALVLSLVNRRMVSNADFHIEEGNPRPCLLTDEGRVRVLKAVEDKLATTLHHPDVSFPVDWRRIMDLQVGRFRRWLLGQVKEYQAWMEH